MANANLIDVTDFTTYAPDVDLSMFGSSASQTTTLSGIISMASQQIVDYCAVDGVLRFFNGLGADPPANKGS